MVELIFLKETGAISPSHSDTKTPNVRHGFGEVLRRRFLDGCDLFFGVANSNVRPVFGDRCPCGSHFEIKMITPIIGFSVFEKRSEALPIDLVRLRFLRFPQFEICRDEVDVLHKLFTDLPCGDTFWPAHDHGHLTTPV